MQGVDAGRPTVASRAARLSNRPRPLADRAKARRLRWGSTAFLALRHFVRTRGSPRPASPRALRRRDESLRAVPKLELDGEIDALGPCGLLFVRCNKTFDGRRYSRRLGNASVQSDLQIEKRRVRQLIARVSETVGCTGEHMHLFQEFGVAAIPLRAVWRQKGSGHARPIPRPDVGERFQRESAWQSALQRACFSWSGLRGYIQGLTSARGNPLVALKLRPVVLGRR